MPIRIDGSEILLSGTVGVGAWDWGDGFDANDVIEALATVGRTTDIVVRLNSGGGIATEGSAIHAALSAHKGTVEIVVEGIAASAASLIAMAGDRVTMRPGSVLMIHDAATIAWGDAAELQKALNGLEAISEAYAGVYADRTGRSAKQMRALMKAETWLTPDQAIAQGFADAAEADPAEEADAEIEPAAFPYSQAYAKAPSRLVAMAEARGWSLRAMQQAAASAGSKGAAEMPKQKTPKASSEAETIELEATAVEPEAPAADEPAEAPAVDAEPADDAALQGLASDGGVEPAEIVESPDSLEPAAQARAAAADIAALCAEAGCPLMAAGLIRDGASLEQARARVSQAGEVRSLVALAGKASSAVTPALADEFITAGLFPDAVRAKLFDRLLANQSPEISPHVAVGAPVASTAPKGPDHRAIFDRMNRGTGNK